MGQSLDETKPIFPITNLTFENRHHDLSCGFRDFQISAQSCQSAMVIFFQLPQPQGHADKGQLMTGQRQVIRARKVLQARAAAQPVCQRAALPQLGVQLLLLA